MMYLGNKIETIQSNKLINLVHDRSFQDDPYLIVGSLARNDFNLRLHFRTYKFWAGEEERDEVDSWKELKFAPLGQ